MPQDQDDIKGADAMKQAPTPGPLSGDDELIERGLRTIRTYDAVRSLRDALSATTSRLTGYDWNADPDSITKQQGDAFASADNVFSDLDAAVAAHPDIDLPECEACNGTGKIEEAARTEGANQHSACIRSCDECDGCGFAPEPSLAPTAPVEASGSEEIGDEYEEAAHCVTLADCPTGLFFWNGTLGFKSEYGAMEPSALGKTWTVGNRADAYCADSGEYFWGGAPNPDDRAKILVMPIDAATVSMVASHGPSALRPQPEDYDRSDVRHGLQLIADEECDEVAAAYYAKKALAALYAAPVPAQDDDKLRAALTDARHWHDARRDDLGKQPPSGDRDWRRMEHADEIARIDAALKSTAAKEGGEV